MSGIFRAPQKLLMVVIGLFLFVPALHASAAGQPEIVLAQARITVASKYFVLYNTSTVPINLSGVQLQYFNNADPAKAITTKYVALTGTLKPQGYHMVSAAAMTPCFQATTQVATITFSTVSGYVQVIRPSAVAGGQPTVLDHIAYVKKTSAPAGVTLQPVGANDFLLRQPTDGLGNPDLTAGEDKWVTATADPANPCSWTIPQVASTVPPTDTTPPNSSEGLLPGSPPEATVVSVAPAASNNVVAKKATSSLLPVADIGLRSPVITELLPNPAKPQTDGRDEYIELYNSNDQPFDLTGFSLQAGGASKKTWKFPSGVTIAPKSFRTLSSADVSISLPNTTGQVWLLDPTGKIVSQTDAYNTPKEGMAWALAGGKWYWTEKPTPNAANIISNAGAITKTASAKKTVKTASIKGASTSFGKDSTVAAAAIKPSDEEPTRPLHPSILAGVAAAALLYGAYEYRHDMVNAFQRLRPNRKTS